MHSNPLRTPILLALLGCLLALARPGAASEPPYSTRATVLPLSQVAVLELDAIDPVRLLAEDQSGELYQHKGQRFAVLQGVDVSPAGHGTWERLADGARLWRLRLSAPRATDLYLGFDRFDLPPGASLWVIGQPLTTKDHRGYYRGPYHNHKAHGGLWTPVVPGSSATIELYLPAAPAAPPMLHLAEVWRGYRDLFARQRRNLAEVSKQGACNIDVICPEGDAWRDEIRSVALYTVSGHWCTGSLVMSTAEDFRNLFLTANHCSLGPGNAAAMTVYWGFESPVCGDLDNGSLNLAQTGAVHLAGRTDNDFTLVELEDEPVAEADVYYAGWDASGTVPQASVCIHQPAADEKAISFNDDPLTTGDSCIFNDPTTPDTHWYVDSWEQGTTEPGSSGAGLWDPATHRIVGYLSGGEASCTVINYDCFGKLAVGWDGDAADSRLKDWLDPGLTGIMAMDGANPPARILLEAVSSSDSCPGGAGHGNGVWEPGELIELSIALTARSAFSAITGSVMSTTAGVQIISPELSWPDLSADATVTNPSPLQVRLPLNLDCYGPISFTIEVNAAEGGPFTFAYSHAIGRRNQPDDVPAQIPDGGDINEVSSELVIGGNVTLSDADIYVEIDHSYVGDLTVTLRSPSGTEVTLLDRPGVPANSYGCGDNNLEITFDDDAVLTAAELEQWCNVENPWFAGRAQPVDPLSVLNGEPAAGTWTLTVNDGAASDTGELVTWSLVSQPETAGQCAVCGDTRPRRIGRRVSP